MLTGSQVESTSPGGTKSALKKDVRFSIPKDDGIMNKLIDVSNTDNDRADDNFMIKSTENVFLSNSDGSGSTSETDSSESSSDSGTSVLTYSRMQETNTEMSKSINQESFIQEAAYKPRSETFLETLTLTSSEFNSRIKGAGFRTDGRPRQIKKDTLLAKVRTRCTIRGREPALAVCITMYNEEEVELKSTLRGLIHNYNCLRAEQDKYNCSKDDFLIFVVCDGYDRIPESFKEFARDKGFLDEEMLVERGFMHRDGKGKFKFKDLKDIMDEGVPESKHPKNILHVFQVTTWDVGIPDDILKGRRVHLCFAVKHRNDGKINSHRWFF